MMKVMTDGTGENRDRDRPDLHFGTPLALADCDDLAYEIRSDMLQTWLARIADGQAVRGTRKEVESAILALQARSKLKMELPEEQPGTTTCGGVERSDLRAYGLRRLLARRRSAFRR